MSENHQLIQSANDTSRQACNACYKMRHLQLRDNQGIRLFPCLDATREQVVQ